MKDIQKIFIIFFKNFCAVKYFEIKNLFNSKEVINLKQWLPLQMRGGQRMGEERKCSIDYVLLPQLDDGHSYYYLAVTTIYTLYAYFVHIKYYILDYNKWKNKGKR